MVLGEVVQCLNLTGLRTQPPAVFHENGVYNRKPLLGTRLTNHIQIDLTTAARWPNVNTSLQLY